MKVTKVVLLIFVMLLVSVEVFTMPTVNNSNNKGGNEQRNKVPGMNGGNGFAGMNTGGGTKTVQQSRYYHPPAPTPEQRNKVPAWMNGGNGFSGMNTGGGTKTVQQPTYDAPGVMLGSGEAPGNTMSDYLRSLYANNLAMSDPYAQPSGYGGYGNGYRGFGSRYGGNWGGGGGYGGGGGDGGGGGYGGDMPAWLANLYLNTWNIR